MLLLTTPDYLPRLGGLTSHTLNIEKVLKDIGVEYRVFHWKSYKDIITYPKEEIEKFEYIINIHSGFQMLGPQSNAKVINFICGAEILFYSPNFLKGLIKKILKRKSLKKIEKSASNIFISDFTFKTLIKKGFKPDYSRDLVFHMCVDTKNQSFIKKNWNEQALRFICVARDVPHKNFAGVIKFCESIQKLTTKKIELITVTNRSFNSDLIKITSYINPENEIRDRLLANSHINLLLSLDHSKVGFFEGFGQIVQEAGIFGTPSLVLSTGGLPESVHHNLTGWVLSDLSELSISNWWHEMNEEHFDKISKECFDHTIESHGLSCWKKLFNKLLE